MTVGGRFPVMGDTRESVGLDHQVALDFATFYDQHRQRVGAALAFTLASR